MLVRYAKDPLNRILLNPPYLSKLKCFQTLKMVDIPPYSRRIVCPSCSKPSRCCLCTRIQNPGVENSVGVIILQHNLEKKHPLNSARIAKLGLKNVDIATVSDINLEARFTIRLREPYSERRPLRNASNSIHFDQLTTNDESVPVDKDFSPTVPNKECSFRNDDSEILKIENQITNSDTIPNEESSVSYVLNSQIRDGGAELSLLNTVAPNASLVQEEAVITATIGKYGSVNSYDQQKHKTDEIFTSPAIRASLEKGFIVKKLQKRQLDGTGNKEFEEHVEFELEIPPKSVLLFPSENAISVSDLDAIDFEVNSLIILDGTWAKAKRMYNENPWLRVLPHLKLELDRISLYSEVRHQPKTGFLSTIESIVYGLKLIGDNPEGLDNLLVVFESMIGDQRRCKDDRLKTIIQL